MKLNVITLSAVLLTAACTPAVAGQTGSDFSNFSGNATRWNGGHTNGHSVTNYQRNHHETGEFTGSTFSFKADSIMDHAGDFKATFNPQTQSFGVWANEGQNVFAVSGSNAATSSQWRTTEKEDTTTWTNFGTHFENDAAGQLLEGSTNAWGN